MRVAFFSPMPPATSGIADYSAALAAELSKLAEVTVFPDGTRGFDPSAHDVALYQLGNNPDHIPVYQAALQHPGIVVLHEANLHHLICDLTIRRDDWDAYIEECAYNGGEAARQHALRVKALEAGPDYHGQPMLRRALERSKGAIVHSRAVEAELRRAGFTGPIARIPHGAWIPDLGERMHYRQTLGLEERTPLVGIFGFLKPYKRINESLRAFRRVVRLIPEAKMILVGQPHPELPLDSLIRTLGLEANVRVLGYTPIQDFTGYLEACDAVLNLRYPTVGESSGTLLRALGLGKPVLVSNVGSFAELPDDVVLKAPVDAAEEDVIFEYLNALLSRPADAAAFGANARRWVARECSWPRVASLYARFLETLEPPVEDAPVPEPALRVPVTEADVEVWAAATTDRHYVDAHLTRLRRTLEITPPGGPDDAVLEMGAYLQITPVLKSRLGYGHVRGCYFGPLGKVDRKRITSLDGEQFECEVDLFDAERDRFPYPEESFTTVLCCELLEHLAEDPMFLMAEVNRVLKPGGHLVLTTPNVGSMRAIGAILTGYHPGFFPAYRRPSVTGEPAESRHSREYVPKEIMLLMLAAGFETTLLETGPFRDLPHPEDYWVRHLLERYSLSTDLRGDGIYAVGRKTGPVRDRYPGWLYE